MFIEDRALLVQIGQRDERAMGTLYDRYWRLVYSVALRVCGDVASAQDILQKIFMQIWRSPQSLAPRGSLAGWVSVVSRNRSIDLLRGIKSMDCVDEVVLPSKYDPGSDAVLNLMMEKAQTLMLNLPAVQRQVLEMALFEGKTHAEIACETGCPLGTTKTRMRSALSSLRKGMEASSQEVCMII
jgi:RNA polymerase sigma-70 factor (ECF subfamily)